MNEHLKGQIIDFRLRPPTLPYKDFFPELVVNYTNFRFGVDTPASYQKSCEGDHGEFDPEALKLLYGEMERGGISIGVMNGRHSYNMGVVCHVSDEYMAELSKESGERLIALAGTDGNLPINEIVAGIERGVKQLGMKGICIEPGLFQKPMYADDERLMPIYQKCADLEVPILFMTGPFAGPDLSYTQPLQFQHVADTFPHLPMVMGHGCYPYVTEVIGAAFKSSAVGSGGIFISPDCYVFAAGGDGYVKGIEWMADRFIFGSAYPFGNCEQLVEKTLNLPLDEEALSQYLFKNAKDILKLK